MAQADEKELIQSEKKFLSSINHAYYQYRKDMSTIISKADKVVLFQVSPNTEEVGNSFMSPKSYISVTRLKDTKILNRKELNKKESKAVIEALKQSILKKQDHTNLDSHTPIHGIKIYKKSKVIFQATLSWETKNFNFNYPNTSEWLETSQELQKIVNTVHPLSPKNKD